MGSCSICAVHSFLQAFLLFEGHVSDLSSRASGSSWVVVGIREQKAHKYPTLPNPQKRFMNYRLFLSACSSVSPGREEYVCYLNSRINLSRKLLAQNYFP